MPMRWTVFTADICRQFGATTAYLRFYLYCSIQYKYYSLDFRVLQRIYKYYSLE